MSGKRLGVNGVTIMHASGPVISPNFTSSDGMLEAKRRWANTISTKQDYSQITEGPGRNWETALNTCKPFARGIVIHPVIDACVHLRDEYGIKPGQVRNVTLKVNPLVLELTGKKTPGEGFIQYCPVSKTAPET